MTVVVESVSDRTSGGTSREQVLDATAADLTLDFQFGGSDNKGRAVEATLCVIPGPRLADVLALQHLALPMSKGALAGQVSKCQAAWWSRVVEHKTAFPDGLGFTYHRNAQVALSPDEFRSDVLPDLAQAGQVLYVQIFRPNNPRYKETREFGDQLRSVLANTSDVLRILIRSESFLAPWNLLYLGDPSTPDPGLFLGARHVVEHDISDSLPTPEKMARPERIGLQLDENIDTDGKSRRFRAVQDFVSLLKRNRLSYVHRNNKTEFLSALREGIPETALYFLCHGTAGSDVKPNSEDVKLYLTRTSDKVEEGIAPSDIDGSLDLIETFPGQPVVFLNACRALKTGSIYYTGFVSSFLNADARAVIGPEIEMPVIFAREFAREFFSRWFGGGPKRTIGLVLLELRREYLFEHGNPLGLTYSLYRGAGHYLPASSTLI